MQKAYFDLGNRFSTEDTHLELRRNCPMMCYEEWNPTFNEYSIAVKEIQSISREGLKNYIAWVQQYAAENLHLILTD